MFDFLRKLNPFNKTLISKPKAYSGGSGYGSYGAGTAGGKWPYSLSAPGSGLIIDHWRTRQMARVAMQDSPQGRSIVERKTDAVAGIGLRLEPTPDTAVLGITPKQAAQWAREVSARFNLWAADKEQHRSATLTFNQAQRLYTYFKERDNDIFMRLYYSPDRALQNPLQFEFLDPNQIRGDTYTTSYGYQQSHDGIERDSRGRETAYQVQVRQKDGSYKSETIRAKGPRSGRVFMLHGYQPEYAGQGRGFTKLAPIIQDLENYTDFSSAHIKMAINQAQIVGWVKPSDDEDAQPVMDGNLTAHGAGPAGSNFSAEGTSEVGALGPSDFRCYELPEATFSQPGSTFIQDLAKGSDITLANPNAPTTTFESFQKAFLTSLSSASGVPLEVVHMQFGNSFSASRATLLLFQRIVEIERQDMVADMLDPIYTMWLSGEIAAGRVIALGWTDPRIKQAWLKSTWRGTPVPDIDPGKLAKARRDNLETAVTNVEFEAQNHSGKSAEDNIAINNLAYREYEMLPFNKDIDPVIEEEEEKEDG